MKLYIIGQSDYEGSTIIAVCEGPDEIDWRAVENEWLEQRKIDWKRPDHLKKWITQIIKEWIEAHPEFRLLEWEWIESP